MSMKIGIQVAASTAILLAKIAIMNYKRISTDVRNTAVYRSSSIPLRVVQPIRKSDKFAPLAKISVFYIRLVDLVAWPVQGREEKSGPEDNGRLNNNETWKFNDVILFS